MKLRSFCKESFIYCSTFSKFSEKPTRLTHWDSNTYVCISGVSFLENFVHVINEWSLSYGLLFAVSLMLGYLQTISNRRITKELLLTLRVRIRSYSGPHFSCIFPHSDWIRRDTPNTNTFYAVFWKLNIICNKNSGYCETKSCKISFCTWIVKIK